MNLFFSFIGVQFLRDPIHNFFFQVPNPLCKAIHDPKYQSFPCFLTPTLAGPDHQEQAQISKP